MAIKVPTFTNTQTAQLSGTPRGKVANASAGLNVGKDIKSVGTALNVLDMANQMSDEAFAAEEFNKYKESISTTKAELLLKQGSDATDLSNQYNTTADTLTEGIEFPNQRAKNAFFNKVKVTSSVDRSTLNMAEVKEQVASNIRQQGVIQDNALNDMIGAVANDDREAIIAATVMYSEAGNSIMQGQDEAVRVTKNAEGISAGLNKQLLRQANYNPASAVSQASKLKKLGLMNENDFQIVASVARGGYVKTLATAKIKEAIENPANNFKTAYEVVGAGSKTFVTNIPYSFKDKQRKINEELSKKVTLNDDIYGDISTELTTELTTARSTYNTQAEKQYKQFTDDISGRIIDATIAMEGLPEGTDKDALRGQIASDYATLRENGEFEMAAKTEKGLGKLVDSKVGALTDASNDVNRGMSEAELLNKYGDKLNTSDLNSLRSSMARNVRSIDKQRQDNMIDMLKKNQNFKNITGSSNEKSIEFLKVQDKALRFFDTAMNDANHRYPEGVPSEVMSTIYKGSILAGINPPPYISDNLWRVEAALDVASDNNFITSIFSNNKEDAMKISNKVYNDLEAKGKPFTEQDFRDAIEKEILGK